MRADVGSSHQVLARVNIAEAHAMMRESDLPMLIAYRLPSRPALPLVPAMREREWIAESRGRFAHRCLPLLMANQAGWVALNSTPLLVTWDGGEGTEALRLVWQGDPPYPAVSHFGHGILTWHLPYLFRTPPGWNLLVRGPANWPKDGIAPLEGLVETDREVAPFAMSWKLTAIETPVRFEADEPICMLVPQRRGELEGFLPEILEIAVLPSDTSAIGRQSRLTLRPFVESAWSRPPPRAPDEAN